MRLVNVFLVNIAHIYMIKSFLGLRNGNAFTEAETGEPPISRENAVECTKSHIKFQNFFRGNTGPPSTDPREGTEGKGREVEGKGGEVEGKGGGKGDKFRPPLFRPKLRPEHNIKCTGIVCLPLKVKNNNARASFTARRL